MTFRLLFDVACGGVGLICAVRLIHQLQSDAAKFGIGFLFFDIIGNYLIWHATGPQEFLPDVAHATTVISLTVLSRGQWARFVPAEYLRNDFQNLAAGSKRLYYWAIILSLILYFPTTYAVNPDASVWTGTYCEDTDNSCLEAPSI